MYPPGCDTAQAPSMMTNAPTRLFLMVASGHPIKLRTLSSAVAFGWLGFCSCGEPPVELTCGSEVVSFEVDLCATPQVLEVSTIGVCTARSACGALDMCSAWVVTAMSAGHCTVVFLIDGTEYRLEADLTRLIPCSGGVYTLACGWSEYEVGPYCVGAGGGGTGGSATSSAGAGGCG